MLEPTISSRHVNCGKTYWQTLRLVCPIERSNWNQKIPKKLPSFRPNNWCQKKSIYSWHLSFCAPCCFIVFFNFVWYSSQILWHPTIIDEMNDGMTKSLFAVFASFYTTIKPNVPVTYPSCVITTSFLPTQMLSMSKQKYITCAVCHRRENIRSLNQPMTHLKNTMLSILSTSYVIQDFGFYSYGSIHNRTI